MIGSSKEILYLQVLKHSCYELKGPHCLRSVILGKIVASLLTNASSKKPLRERPHCPRKTRKFRRPACAGFLAVVGAVTNQ